MRPPIFTWITGIDEHGNKAEVKQAGWGAVKVRIATEHGAVEIAVTEDGHLGIRKTPHYNSASIGVGRIKQIYRGRIK